MLPIRKILHPTDFSDSSRPALELAAALARDYRAALVLIHVVPTPHVFAPDGVAVAFPVEQTYEVQGRLAQYYPTEKGLEVEHHVLEGDPADQILKAATKVNADMIVMGTHGNTGLTRLLMGSVAETVLRKAPCPVLTVRGPLHLAAEQSAPT